MAPALFTAVALLAGVSAGSVPVRTESAPHRGVSVDRVPVLVELFTSEGCSSCPPADALLRDLMAAQPIDDVEIIGLSEHVDYWNRLGWTDPFSSSSYSARQSAYAAAAKSNQVYTPQMVVDGDTAFVGSDRTQALAAIAAAAARPKASVTLQWVDSRRLDVFIPLGQSAAKVPVWLVVSENGLTVDVATGENRGRTLVHDGVVRRLLQIGRTADSGGFHASLVVPAESGWNVEHLRVSVFAQVPGQPITALGTIAYRSY